MKTSTESARTTTAPVAKELTAIDGQQAIDKSKVTNLLRCDSCVRVCWMEIIVRSTREQIDAFNARYLIQDIAKIFFLAVP